MPSRLSSAHMRDDSSDVGSIASSSVTAVFPHTSRSSATMFTGGVHAIAPPALCPPRAPTKLRKNSRMNAKFNRLLERVNYTPTTNVPLRSRRPSASSSTVGDDWDAYSAEKGSSLGKDFSLLKGKSRKRTESIENEVPVYGASGSAVHTTTASPPPPAPLPPWLSSTLTSLHAAHPLRKLAPRAPDVPSDDTIESHGWTVLDTSSSTIVVPPNLHEPDQNYDADGEVDSYEYAEDIEQPEDPVFAYQAALGGDSSIANIDTDAIVEPGSSPRTVYAAPVYSPKADPVSTHADDARHASRTDAPQFLSNAPRFLLNALSTAMPASDTAFRTRGRSPSLSRAGSYSLHGSADSPAFVSQVLPVLAPQPVRPAEDCILSPLLHARPNAFNDNLNAYSNTVTPTLSSSFPGRSADDDYNNNYGCGDHSSSDLDSYSNAHPIHARAHACDVSAIAHPRSHPGTPPPASSFPHDSPRFPQDNSSFSFSDCRSAHAALYDDVQPSCFDLAERFPERAADAGQTNAAPPISRYHSTPVSFPHSSPDPGPPPCALSPQPGPAPRTPSPLHIHFDAPSSDPLDPCAGVDVDALDFRWAPFDRGHINDKDESARDGAEARGRETGIARVYNAYSDDSGKFYYPDAGSPREDGDDGLCPRLSDGPAADGPAADSPTDEVRPESPVKAVFAPAPGVFISPLRNAPPSSSPAHRGRNDTIKPEDPDGDILRRLKRPVEVEPGMAVRKRRRLIPAFEEVASFDVPEGATSSQASERDSIESWGDTIADE